MKINEIILIDGICQNAQLKQLGAGARPGHKLECKVLLVNSKPADGFPEKCNVLVTEDGFEVAFKYGLANLTAKINLHLECSWLEVNPKPLAAEQFKKMGMPNYDQYICESKTAYEDLFVKLKSWLPIEVEYPAVQAFEE